MSRKVPFSVKLLLFALVLIGFGLNVWMFVDLEWVHWLEREVAGGESPPAELVELADAVRESIVLVRVETCAGDGSASFGTGFVVEPGYVATCAHLVEAARNCGNEITLRDHEGAMHVANLESLDRDRDIALVSISDASLPSLLLADSALYLETDDVVSLITMGYPLLGAASSPDRAALSDVGNLSLYSDEQEAFVTSGLNINPGNSGGPVFLVDTWEVLGIASSRLDPTQVDGIGYSIPIDSFRDFFRATVGRDLGAP